MDPYRHSCLARQRGPTIATESTWTQQAYVKASNTDAGDWFGWSVALSGDTLAVGAPNEASAATGVNGHQAFDFAYGAGAVYVRLIAP